MAEPAARRPGRLPRATALLLLLAAMPAGAQELSIDGNRWYEVEVTIFSREPLPVEYPEAHLPRTMDPGYPERLIRLRSPLESLSFPFATPGWHALLADSTTDNSPLSPLLTWRNAYGALDGASRVYGPPEQPGEQGEFSLPDRETTPFLRLGDSVGRFADYHRRLSDEGGHRIFFHAVWRQPVLNKPQARAIAVSGGERYGAHRELEGSLTISFNVNRINIDARLWRNRFASEFNEDVRAWQLPPLPFEPREESSGDGGRIAPPQYFVESVAYLAQDRDMVSNELHYLDHPHLGVLVEVRPYLLPETLDEDLDAP